MKPLYFTFPAALMVASIACAQSNQEVMHSFKTPLGILKEVGDIIRPNVHGEIYLTLNYKLLLRGKNAEGGSVSLMFQDCQTLDSAKNGNLYQRMLYREVFAAGGSVGWEKYYVIDLTGKEPVVSPGFDNGDLTYVQKTVWKKNDITVYFKDKGKVFSWQNFQLKEIPRTK